ncbi:MAG: patatin family protein [Arcanobacterium sp.]|nr:patatin family protein [Arcanobacterium sp.]
MFENNVFDTALILEGGGMRGGYTAGAVNAMLEHEIYINYVSGISAGTTNLINYMARLPERSRRSFIDLPMEPEFGDAKTFIEGKGIFNSRFIYHTTTQPGQLLPMTIEQFTRNPGEFRIGAFNTRLGETLYFSRDHVDTMEKLEQVACASSSMPMVMPPTQLGDDIYVDGAIGENAGIPLDIAIRDGYEKYLIILTRPRNFVKRAPRAPHTVRQIMRSMPLAAEAYLSRWERYNAVREQIAQLERDGKAYVIYADDMLVSNQERDVKLLTANFRNGYDHIIQEMAPIREFLGLAPEPDHARVPIL